MTNNSVKKIGLALGGGGAKGLAHIGVIRGFEAANIPISYITGTSMGALVGGIYAATRDLNGLTEIFLNLDKGDIFPFSKIIRKREGLFKDKTVAERIRALADGMKIEKCKIPFRAVATDVRTGDETVLKKGNLADAIEASTALPLAYRPIEIDGKLLMDGGFVNPVPADVCRAMGADIVIAVDVSSRWPHVYEEGPSFRNLYSILSSALAVIEYEVGKQKLTSADIVLHPQVMCFKWFNFEYSAEIVKAGEAEALAHIRRVCSMAGYPEPQKTVFEKFIDFILPAV